MKQFEVDKFVDTVRRMREAQQEFFRTHNKKAFTHSLLLEGVVDMMLRDYPDNRPPQPQQPGLFDNVE